MARNSPLKYAWKDSRLIGAALADTNASQSPPTKHELEIFRIFQEHHQLQAENKRLKGVIEKYARHTHRCFMGQYNSLKTGNGCDCGLSEAIKTISKE